MAILGTRPELVKLAPLLRILGAEIEVVHTGQHYDESLFGRTLRGLGLDCRFHDLRLGPGRRAGQLGAMLTALDGGYAGRPPRAVVVQGDTTSALAGALFANATDVPLVHVEAGLRSFDRAMPEEHHRVLIDHLADVCCAPTPVAERNLLREAVPKERVLVTGNTIVEALAGALAPLDARHALLDRLGLVPEEYVVATFHRPENVDAAGTLATILAELAKLPLPVVLPVHPRTRRRIAAAGLERFRSSVRLIEPLGYREFLSLLSLCSMVVSDSGGVQEEASVLKRPIIVVRRSTERPEILGSFGVLVPPGPRLRTTMRCWLEDGAEIRSRITMLPSPFGDGLASERIAAVMRGQAEGSPPGGQASPQSMSRAAR